MISFCLLCIAAFHLLNALLLGAQLIAETDKGEITASSVIALVFNLALLACTVYVACNVSLED